MPALQGGTDARPRTHDDNREVRDTDVRPGFQALAGGRLFLSQHVALFLEYKFLKPGELTFNVFREPGTRGGAPVVETARGQASLTIHQIVTGSRSTGEAVSRRRSSHNA